MFVGEPPMYFSNDRSWSRCSADQANTRISTIPPDLEAVQAELALICTTHNTTKLAKAI
jgi:hypothetical protein